MYTFTIAVCDTNPGQMGLLRSLCTKMAIRANLEIRLLRFSQASMRDQVLQYCDAVNLALISLDMDGGFELGCAVTRQNPDCYLLFYRHRPCEIAPLLWARPIAFYSGALSQEKMEPLLLSLCRDILERLDTLHYTTKAITGVLPYRSIICAESDRKHVKIHVRNGHTVELYQKLDELEKAVSNGSFCRVHQSWLVNLSNVVCLVRTQHLLYMENGESVPVSRAYYEKAVNALETYFEQRGSGLRRDI